MCPKRPLLLAMLALIVAGMTGCMLVPSIPAVYRGIPNLCASSKLKEYAPNTVKRVMVESQTPGIMVYLDGSYLGITPLDTVVPNIFYSQLSLSTLSGWVIDGKTVASPPGANISLHELYPQGTTIDRGWQIEKENPYPLASCASKTLRQAGPQTRITMATIRIVTIPPGANVSLNGVVVGQTPFAAHVNATLQSVSLMVQGADGRGLWGAPVFLAPGSTLYVFRDFLKS